MRSDNKVALVVLYNESIVRGDEKALLASAVAEPSEVVCEAGVGEASKWTSLYEGCSPVHPIWYSSTSPAFTKHYP